MVGYEGFSTLVAPALAISVVDVLPGHFSSLSFGVSPDKAGTKPQVSKAKTTEKKGENTVCASIRSLQLNKSRAKSLVTQLQFTFRVAAPLKRVYAQFSQHFAICCVSTCDGRATFAALDFTTILAFQNGEMYMYLAL